MDVPKSDHPLYSTLTPREKYLWERQFRRWTDDEIEENRATTIEQRFEQLAILNSIGRRLDFHWYTEAEIGEVRQRWARLKQLHAEGKLKRPL